MSPEQLYPWLEPYWLQIKSLKNQNRLPHALMLKSIDGLGAEQLAKVTGSALLCQNPTEAGLACGECRDCKLVYAGTHPDFHLITIPEDKNSIGVNQIRSLVKLCRERPHQGGFRIVIIDPGAAMTTGAANALLKTLEEPGEDTLLILVSSTTNSLPATVRSRCHLLNIEPPSESVGLDWLCEKHYEDKNKTLLALRLSHHAPVYADQLLTSEILQVRQNFFAGLAKVARGKLDPVKLASTINKSTIGYVTEWLYGLALDAQKYSYNLSSEKLTNNDQNDLLQLIASHQGAVFDNWVKRLVESRRLLSTSSNINPQLILEDLLIHWIAIFK